jgi:uncharacterized protein
MDRDDVPSNNLVGIVPTIGDIIYERYSRRAAIRGLLGAGVIAGLGPSLSGCSVTLSAAEVSRTNARFAELERGIDRHHHVAPDHEVNVIIRWGDPLISGTGPFDPTRQSAEEQSRRFGYNNDFVGLVPLPPTTRGEQRALLCVNHEYTIPELMFPRAAGRELTSEECEIEKAAHGGSVVEIVRPAGGKWLYLADSRYNRRITATSPTELSGPAAGSPRLATMADPHARHVLGTLNNCAGGMTPWGTWLMAEENFNYYFMGEPVGAEAVNYRRYGLGNPEREWGRFDPRFNLADTPNEPNRFGWVVEVDPRDPLSIPKKRTALGRFKHEGAETVLNRDGRVVIYMGDDQRFDYVYKFVTADAYDPRNPTRNRDLLDQGTLYVARFDADGTLEWLPLVYERGPLTVENGFASQADVVIEARRAADLLGATPMDRPEDVEPDPRSGRVYVMLTNNSRRTAEQVDAANPRAQNAFGHIVEIVEPDRDFASERASWNVLIKCGDPEVAEVGAMWGPETSDDGWFAYPDNVAIDGEGRLWVSTDGPEKGMRCTNGVWSVEADGPDRGRSTLFYRGPTGAEICGPRFSQDGSTFFAAVQHPAEDGENYPPHGRISTFEDPSTRWPDFDPGMPPRPSVVAIRRRDGGRIGS